MLVTALAQSILPMSYVGASLRMGQAEDRSFLSSLLFWGDHKGIQDPGHARQVPTAAIYIAGFLFFIFSF